MTHEHSSSVQKIIDHYERFEEDSRLSGPFGELEFARTQEVIERGLPPSPADILDLGGGTGAYAFWLAGLGHRVTLVDLVPRHIETARRRQLTDSADLVAMSTADARDPGLLDESFDAIVLHGPLYHFPQLADRVAVLEACLRLLRPGGVLLAFGITRYAGLLYALSEGLVFHPAYREMIEAELATGVRSNCPEGFKTFPEAYFHLPTELESEIASVGFDVRGRHGVAGPVWQVADFDTAWQENSKRDVLLALSRSLEDEPTLSPTHLCVGQKRRAA